MTASSAQLFEALLESAQAYDNPTWDVSLRARLTSPSGREREIEAFWDGDQVWRLRFSPDEAGTWTYRTSCSDTSNASLHDQEDSFTVDPYEGDSPLYLHGPLKLSENRRHFVHADGTPFFWLADTAWNGVLKAKPQDWDDYLAMRREQGFTAVQCVMTQWRAFEDEAAFTRGRLINKKIKINPRFFQKLDAKVAAIGERGLVPALVLLWALTSKDPGNYLPEEDCIKLARHIVARYGAYRPIWMLGGDGRYLGEIERWKRIGRGVFADPEAQLVTLHPAGMEWVGEAFGDERWYSFMSYQSGHGDDDATLRWLVGGPPAEGWTNEPVLPVVNQEPCYEAHLAYQSRQPFDAYKVRRALYWSLLISPTAGVTYGHHGVWPWMEERGVPLDHPGSGEAPTWREALESEGATSVGHLKAFFSGLDWWKLRPAPQLIAEQPGEHDPSRYAAAARAEDNSFAVVYIPAGDAVILQESFDSARWYDPRSGQWQEVPPGADQRFSPPGQDDWLLLLKR